MLRAEHGWVGCHFVCGLEQSVGLNLVVSEHGLCFLKSILDPRQSLVLNAFGIAQIFPKSLSCITMPSSSAS